MRSPTVLVGADVEDAAGLAGGAPDGMSEEDRPETLGRFLGWSGEISWRDRSGFKTAKHRPDLVACRPRARVNP